RGRDLRDVAAGRRGGGGPALAPADPGGTRRGHRRSGVPAAARAEPPCHGPLGRVNLPFGRVRSPARRPVARRGVSARDLGKGGGDGGAGGELAVSPDRGQIEVDESAWSGLGRLSAGLADF